MPRRSRQDLEDKIRYRWSDEWEELLDERAPRVYLPETQLRMLWEARLRNEGSLVEIYFKHVEPLQPDPVKFLRGLLFRVDKYIRVKNLLNANRSSVMSEIVHNYLVNQGVGSNQANREGLNLGRKVKKK